MPLPVQIRDIVDGMEFQSDGRTSYLQLASGEVYTVSDDELSDGDLAEDEDGPDAIARAIDSDPDAYIALPDRFEINEYRMMERFALAIADVQVQEQLLMTLRGSGAFRRFKDAVHSLGLVATWYQEREAAYAKIARDWCVVHGIPFEDSPADA